MDNHETKMEFIESLYSRGVYVKKVDSKEYVTRCPFCGDSVKSKNTGHLYIKISLDDDSPIQYHCFKCDAGGIFKSSDLSLFGIINPDLEGSIDKMNKESRISSSRKINTPIIKYFDFKIPPIKRGNKSRYIESRLGINLSDSDLEEMKFISSYTEFMRINHLQFRCSEYITKMLDTCYVGFLSFGNSHILFRDITNTQKIRWLKYPITRESKENRIFYSTQLSISKLTTEPININLAEGIMDILSVKHNLGHNGDNDINIAVSGKSYDKILDFMIDNAFFGSNVTVNIYSDNDEKYNKKKNTIPTTMKWYSDKIGIYKNLFKCINIYYNILGKDVGVPKDKIILNKNKL